ncbi:MAG: hypothetical protein M1840_001231 [Geoglossum simile]|nr:MAG: hypothetical protein M1840_001231 [Geoglossum simile]
MAGIKVWYIQPQRKESDCLRWKEQDAEGPKGYEDGWIKKILQRNDVLTIPSGTPHAVWSPEDTLAAGGHFCLGMSEILRELLRDEEHSELTNDEVPEGIFEILSNYLTRVPNNKLEVDDVELNALWLELREYTKRKSIPAGLESTEKRKAHLKRRKDFLMQIKSENWLDLLHKRLSLSE